ncbi:hypothetical protein GCM10010448_27450 [Streptomyces glomeratus]|uniref:Uncharacterized protein n=1 Tax=Streptomyces glomeratus TaxID=284452 RepID=A0ABP6LGB0_9ACTN
MQAVRRTQRLTVDLDTPTATLPRREHDHTTLSHDTSLARGLGVRTPGYSVASASACRSKQPATASH